MRTLIDHYCSVVPGKSRHLGSPFSGKLRKSRFQLEWWSLELRFFCPHWTPIMDSIYPMCKQNIQLGKKKHVGMSRNANNQQSLPTNSTKGNKYKISWYSVAIYFGHFVRGVSILFILKIWTFCEEPSTYSK